ncbi:hypothetical protein [Ancylobacter amanitiformis]|uniref:Uncharacterized protein n=1 Tax=Ancylobacter amanitiformis TaxID=217069 RepID=A0ABU0LPK5_9HYPH|nr:hypothetical protein [Ancylobacter amanitiformis]MDQ0510624.1 hypothetical protein [Ancylobacter amanitiformis]
MSPFLDRLGGIGAALLVIGWCISAPLGMIYWGAKGWLLGVVLSLIVPAYGLVSTVFGVLG